MGFLFLKYGQTPWNYTQKESTFTRKTGKAMYFYRNSFYIILRNIFAPQLPEMFCFVRDFFLQCRGDKIIIIIILGHFFLGGKSVDMMLMIVKSHGLDVIRICLCQWSCIWWHTWSQNMLTLVCVCVERERDDHDTGIMSQVCFSGKKLRTLEYWSRSALCSFHQQCHGLCVCSQAFISRGSQYLAFIFKQ